MADIIIHPDVSNVIVRPTVTEPVIDIFYGEQGPVGPQGPQGPPGLSGAQGYYGAFSDYTDQSTTANTPKAMTFNTTDESFGVSIVAGSKITFSQSGTYNLQWSGQFQNTANTDADVYVWMRKNGFDVLGSTGVVSLPKNPGQAAHVLPSWNFVFTVTAGDFYELWWSTTNSSVTIETYSAFTNPTRPSTASLVLTVTQVMNNQQGPQGPQGDPGIYVGPTPPANTSLLWVDTS